MHLAPVPVPSRAVDLHQRLVAASRAFRAAEHDIAVLLSLADAERLFRGLGYSTLGSYAQRELDLAPGKARALARLGRALPSFPAIDAAWAEGRLTWTKAREVLRVVTPETEHAWVERAMTVTNRELEDQVSASMPGEAPPEQFDALGPSRRRLVVDMEASDYHVVMDLLTLIQEQARMNDEELDRGAALASAAQELLARAPDATAPTGERYRILLQKCPDCGRMDGLTHEASEAVYGEACCDAEVIDLQPGPTRGHRSSTIPPATRRAVLARDAYRCVVPDCRCGLWVDVHHLRAQSLGGDHSEPNLATLCTAHHRLVHAGSLAIERDGEELVFRFADGRLVRREHRAGMWRTALVGDWRTGPRGREVETRGSTHVGRWGSSPGDQPT